MRDGSSLAGIADRIRVGVAGGITQARIASRAAGLSVAAQEIEAVGLEVKHLRPAMVDTARDMARGDLYGSNYAKQWLKKAEGETVAEAVKVANGASAGSLNRIGVTESAGAFNSGRIKALTGLKEHGGGHDAQVEHAVTSLLKVWDAKLDACPICAAADGTIVGVRESFPLGEPGTVHPWCQCTFSILTFEERGEEGLIEPKEPAKIILLPARAEQKPAPPITRPIRAPIVPAAGYLAEQAGNQKRAIAYGRMVSSRVVPEALRSRRLSVGFKRIVGGLEESRLDFLRSGYRAKITPYDGVTGIGAINDIATGRGLPPGSSRPLPPIKLGIEGKSISLIDGRHRLEAAQAAGATEIRARIFQYDKELNVVWSGERVIPLPKPDLKNPHGRN